MSQLVIADLDETTLKRLRDRATAHGRTAEREARAILSEFLRAETCLPTNAVRDSVELALAERLQPEVSKRLGSGQCLAEDAGSLRPYL